MSSIIRVEPDDELPAILDRLPANAPCLLVLPPHARALNSIVGAKLLARRAESLGAQVAVVSDDHAVAAHLRAAGLPVAQSIDDARRLLARLAQEQEQTHAQNIIVAAPRPGRAAVETPLEDDIRDIHTTPTAQQPALNIDQEDHDLDGATGASARSDSTGGAKRHSDAAAGGSVPIDPDTSFTFVAGEPGVVEEREDEGDHDRSGSHEGTDAAGIRGHSGGVRAARGSAQKIVPPVVPSAGSGRAHRSAGPAAVPAGPRPRRKTRSWLRDVRVPPGLARLLGLVALLIVLLLLLWWLIGLIFGGLFAPTANIAIQARPVTVTGATTVHAFSNLPPARQDSYHVAMYAAAQPEQGKINVPVHGTLTLPGHVATGHVELANHSTASVTVPAGTTFTTASGVAFVSTASVTLPAAKQSFGSVQYGTGSVAIKAARGGASGNVPAGAITTVSSAFANVLQVKNSEPTTGGTDIRERVVTTSDLQAAATKLFAQLEQRARQDIARAHGGDVEVHTLWVARAHVIPRMSADRTSATLPLSIVLHATYVNRSALRPAALAALAAPAGTQVIGPSVSWTSTWHPDNSITLDVSGHAAPVLNEQAMAQALEGLSKTQADAYLRSRGDIATYHLDLSPPWADHLPTDPSHIHITVEEPQ